METLQFPFLIPHPLYIPEVPFHVESFLNMALRGIYRRAKTFLHLKCCHSTV